MDRCREKVRGWVKGWVGGRVGGSTERTCVATQAGADGKAAVDEETKGTEWGGGLVR